MVKWLPALRSLLFIFACICFAGGLKAQRVKSIQLDTLSAKRIEDVVIEGNQVTRRKIILRECTFAIGDTIRWSKLREKLERTRQNLLNTHLFNFVTVEPLQIDNYRVIVSITVQERWYTFPYPIFENAETNFNTWWEKKDFSRTNYGLYLVRDNFRGLNEKLSFTARFGYTKKFAIAYDTPNLNKNQTLGLSSSLNYYEKAEITYNTENNKREFYKDPSGLAVEAQEYKLALNYRPDLNLVQSVELKFTHAGVRDTVVTLNPNYFVGDISHISYLSLTYSFDFDKRDYKKYPLKGYEIYGVLEQSGLGLTQQTPFSVTTLEAGWRHHIELGKNLYFGYSFKGKLVPETNVPYYLTEALGYNDFVRGYEYYVIDGTRYGLLKTDLKMRLFQKRNINIPLVPGKQFNRSFLSVYGNIYADLGRTGGGNFALHNSLANEWLPGVGVGIDLVTYYDVVMRVEYSVDRLGEGGIFIHFKQAL